MAGNGSNNCKDELSLGFSLLYLTVPLHFIIVCKSILVTVTMIRTTSLHTNTNFLVASMSMADLVLGTAFFCFGLAEHHFFYFSAGELRVIINIAFGEWYCGLVVCLCHNGIIAIDRYILIAHPFYYIKHVTKKCVCVTLFFVWIIGLICLLLPVVVFRGDNNEQRCILIHSPLDFYSVGSIVYLSSCITILVCYFRIAILAFKHKMAANARKYQHSNTNVDIVFANNFTAALRSVKFFALMFGVFLFCTLPPVIFCGININHNLSKYYYMPIMCLMPVNSILNFIIYFNMNMSFSQAVRKTFSDLRACVCKPNI